MAVLITAFSFRDALPVGLPLDLFLFLPLLSLFYFSLFPLLPILPVLYERTYIYITYTLSHINNTKEEEQQPQFFPLSQPIDEYRRRRRRLQQQQKGISYTPITKKKEIPLSSSVATCCSGQGQFCGRRFPLFACVHTPLGPDSSLV
jgi:hypothetical protein